MKRWLGLALVTLLLAGVRAEVRESLEFTTYPVRPRAGESLREALNRASPIREQDRVFHGYTEWQVSWRFWWERTDTGDCRIKRVETSVSGHIRLPRLEAANAAQRARFERYEQALREHELGHFGFAQRAGREIDRGVERSPGASSCPRLERAANDLGHRVLERYLRLEDAYDRRTGHGRTQGAWLGSVD